MADAREILAGIVTTSDMVACFSDEHRCRRLLEELVWPSGRICPAAAIDHRHR